MSIKRFDGTNQADISAIKRFDGSNWIDISEAKRFDGINWIDVWSPINNYFTYQKINANLSTVTASSDKKSSNVAMNGSTEVSSRMLLMIPDNIDNLPISIQIKFTAKNLLAGQAVVGIYIAYDVWTQQFAYILSGYETKNIEFTLNRSNYKVAIGMLKLNASANFTQYVNFSNVFINGIQYGFLNL